MSNLLSSSLWYPFDFTTPLSSVRAAAIWLTVALIAAFIVMLCVFKAKKRELKGFFKASFLTAAIYAIAISILSFGINIYENSADGAFLTILFVPIALLLVSVAVTLSLVCYSQSKKVKIIAASFSAVLFVVTLVAIGVHFAKGDGAQMNGIENKDVNSVALYLSSILLTCGVIFTAFMTDKKAGGFDTRSITYAGATIAMSFCLSYLRIVKMPQGGSITIGSLLPIMVYSYIFGTKKGLLCGMVYGLLQAIQDPYIIHPAQFLLDYPLAFGCIGLSGIFADCKKINPPLKFAFGAALGGILRFLMHYLSGVFAFSAFAGDQNPFLYSFIYQAGYVLPDIAIVIVIGFIVFSSKSFMTFISTKTPANENAGGTN